MRSHSMLVVEIFNQAVALDPRIAQRDISGKKIVESLTEFSRISKKAVKIAVYCNLGGISPNPLPILLCLVNPISISL